MRIAIIGATGNAGTALLRRIEKAREGFPETIELVGVARRLPDAGQEPYTNVQWHALDVGLESDAQLLRNALTGVDAVVHLAWQIQPNRDLAQLHRTNVTGTANVLQAVRETGVRHVVCASSVGAYSKAAKDVRTAEDWPTAGIDSSHYSRHKAEQETLLDAFAADNPSVTVARLRPGLIFQHSAGSQIGRYFLGYLVPKTPLAHLALPVLPVPGELVFQAVHADDVADAYWKVLEQRAGGAFNVAAEPVLTPSDLARLFRARRMFPLPLGVLRAAVDISWRLRLQATDAGWVDMAAAVPVMDTTRVRETLGWQETKSSRDAIREVLNGMSAGGGVQGSPTMRPRRRWGMAKHKK